MSNPNTPQGGTDPIIQPRTPRNRYMPRSSGNTTLRNVAVALGVTLLGLYGIHYIFDKSGTALRKQLALQETYRQRDAQVNLSKSNN